jgi:alanine dehydrogenase
VKIGIPKEIKNHEYRVAITPAGVYEFIRNSHEVIIEKSAGIGSAISDQDFMDAGAKIVDDPDEVWKQSELILKVKEPIESEYYRLRENQVLFTYLHLAASKKCTDALLASKITAIAYETVEDNKQQLPLLAPMSEVAGRLATQVGAQTLLKFNNGRGVLLAGVPGVTPAKVVVIGGGVAGINSAKIALGMGADVTVLDTNISRLREIDSEYEGRIRTLVSNHFQLHNEVRSADLVIGAVLIPGAKAPKLVTNEMVSHMKTGSVLVDIAIDQGGCFEDSRPTTHADPTYAVHDSIFYCVANMPGAVPNTSTYALTNVTLPYSLRIANQGFKQALKVDIGLSKGLNTHKGLVTNQAVANEFNLRFTSPSEVLG